MVTGIRRWPSGLTRFLDAKRYHPRIKPEGMLRPKRSSGRRLQPRAPIP